MQYFPPFPQNPVVPSYYAYQAIDFNNSPNDEIEFVFPNSFEPIPEDEALTKFEMASVIQFTNSGTSTPQLVTLPDATLGSTGIGSLFFNNTTSNIQVYVFDNSLEVLTLTPGQQFILFLTDNSTQNGVWLPIQVGVGTSAANAAALAGNGLRAIANTLNVITNVSDVTSLPTTFSNTDGFKMYNVTSISGPSYTWTIPVKPYAGFSFYIKNSSSNILVLQPTGIAQIDNQGQVSLSFNDGAYILSDGDNWLTIGLNQSYQGAVEISSTGIRVLNGSASTPSYSFINYQDVGIFTLGSNDISFTSSGTLIASIEQAGMNMKNGDYLKNGVPISYLGKFYP